METFEDIPHGRSDPLEHAVFKMPLKEDQGVVAQDGFGFQHDCLTKCSIRMLGDDTLVAVVCETHEDGVLVFSDGTAELLSCKARTPTEPFTVNALLNRGGVLHLFDRWDHTGRICRCRLMTDGELNADAKELVACCHSRKRERVLVRAEHLVEQFGQPAEGIADFLMTLSVDNNDLRPRNQLGLIVSYHDLRGHCALPNSMSSGTWTITSSSVRR